MFPETNETHETITISLVYGKNVVFLLTVAMSYFAASRGSNPCPGTTKEVDVSRLFWWFRNALHF